MPFTADLDLAPLRQEVDDGHAHAVQTSGGLIGALLEFAAELEHRHHAFQRRDVAAHFMRELLVPFDGNPAAVIFDRDGAVRVDGHRDVLGKAGHRFVDRVVDDFVDQVVQASLADIADVHGRAFAHVFQIGKVLQVLGSVLHFGLWLLRDPSSRLLPATTAPGLFDLPVARSLYSWVFHPCRSIEVTYAKLEVAYVLCGQFANPSQQFLLAEGEFLYRGGVTHDDLQGAPADLGGPALVSQFAANGGFPERPQIIGRESLHVTFAAHEAAEHVGDRLGRFCMPLSSQQVFTPCRIVGSISIRHRGKSV